MSASSPISSWALSKAASFSLVFIELPRSTKSSVEDVSTLGLRLFSFLNREDISDFIPASSRQAFLSCSSPGTLELISVFSALSRQQNSCKRQPRPLYQSAKHSHSRSELGWIWRRLQRAAPTSSEVSPAFLARSILVRQFHYSGVPFIISANLPDKQDVLKMSDLHQLLIVLPGSGQVSQLDVTPGQTLQYVPD